MCGTHLSSTSPAGVGSFVVVFGARVDQYIHCTSWYCAGAGVACSLLDSFTLVSIVLAFVLASVVPLCRASGQAGIRRAAVHVAVCAAVCRAAIHAGVRHAGICSAAVRAAVHAAVFRAGVRAAVRAAICRVGVRAAVHAAICHAAIRAGVCRAGIWCTGIIAGIRAAVRRTGIRAGDCCMLAFALASVLLVFALASIVLAFALASILLAFALAFASLLLIYRVVRVHVTISTTIKYRVSNQCYGAWYSPVIHMSRYCS